MWKCARITKSVRWVGIQVCDLPTYEGLSNLESFLIEFEEKVYKPQCQLAMDVALKATPARWWVVHKKTISEWSQCQILMEAQSGEMMLYTSQKYTRLTNHVKHIDHCRMTWETLP